MTFLLVNNVKIHVNNTLKFYVWGASKDSIVVYFK